MALRGRKVSPLRYEHRTDAGHGDFKPADVRNGLPERKPYTYRGARGQDEAAAQEAARTLAALRAKLPPEWHAWYAEHLAEPIQRTSQMGVTELAWLRFWREAV